MVVYARKWTDYKISFNTHECYQNGPYGMAGVRREVRLEVPRTFQLCSVKGWAISMFSCGAFRRVGGMYSKEREVLVR